MIIGEDIGKYPAYSLIGSDHNFDRFYYVATMGIDNSLSREAEDQISLVYRGGFGLDEDFIYNNEHSQYS